MGWSNAWSHNLFVLWALDFLLWVVPDSKTQMHTLVSLSPLLFLVLLSLLTATPPPPPPPPSSHSPSIYSSRWVGKSWLFLIVSGNRGPMSLLLSGCLVGSGSMSGKSGIGTGSRLKRAIWQGYSPRQNQTIEMWHLEQSCSYPWCSWLGKAQVMDQGVRVKIAGPMGLRPSIMGCGPSPQPSEPGALPRTMGWGHGHAIGPRFKAKWVWGPCTIH